jgi:tetratricopeptide (TPR) repeat protein
LISDMSDNVGVAEPLFQEGLGHLKSREYLEAVKCFDKAIEIEKEPIYLCNKGLALCRLEKNEEAIECYGKAIEINPNLADAWKDVGLVLKDSGRYHEAVKCYGKAIEINPNLADAWLAKGLVLTQLEKDEEAIEQFNKAIELNPESVDALNQKGKALYHLERYEEAIECHDAVLKIKENEDAYFFRGQSKCAIEDYNSALEDLNKVSDRFPFRDEKTTSIGHCYYELGFYEDAENHYREAIKSSPKMIRAYFHLAVLYANENKYDRAKKQLETCLNVNRNFSKARDAIKMLDGAGEPDWYRWWFGDGHKNNNKKKTGNDNEMRKKWWFDRKPILGTIVMAFIAGIMITTIILAFSYPSTLASSVVAALTFSMAIMIGVLLLPSLKRFKAAGIEIEPNPFVLTIEMMRSLYVMDKSHREVLFMYARSKRNPPLDMVSGNTEKSKDSSRS